jgi:hypothetical protein
MKSRLAAKHPGILNHILSDVKKLPYNGTFCIEDLLNIKSLMESQFDLIKDNKPSAIVGYKFVKKMHKTGELKEFLNRFDVQWLDERVGNFIKKRYDTSRKN